MDEAGVSIFEQINGKATELTPPIRNKFFKKVNMSNCSEHKKDLFGQTDMKVVAEAIGDLHYETMSQLFQWIRIVKLERFIGTLLSISKMFINHHDSKNPVNSHDLYLVSISPFYTEENLHVLVMRKEHIYFDLILASMQDFIKIKECYTNIDGFSFKAYVKRIINFVGKALQLPIPQKLQDEIENL